MKQTKNTIQQSISIILLTLLLAFNSLGKSVICPYSNVEGFEKEHENGDIYVSKDYTSGLKGLEFYLSAKDDYLFLQSNFKPNDANYKYPIKIVTSDYYDLKLLVQNVLTLGGEWQLPQGFANAFTKDSILYCDIDLLTNPKLKSLNLGKSNNVYFVDNQGGKWRLKTLENQKYLEISSNIRIKIPYSDPQKLANFKFNIGELSRNLESSFNKEKIKLLAIVNDLDTQEAIKSKIPSDNVIKPDSFKMEDFAKVFEANKEQKIFLLGHFDNKKNVFVATDEFDKTIAEINFNELEKIAGEHDVKLYPLGCETGKTNNEKGTLQKFNSVDAVNRLQSALDASNWNEFFKILGKDDLEFIVTNSFIKDGETTIDADIIKRGGDGKPPTKVGSIRVSFQGNRSVNNSNTTIYFPCPENGNNNASNSNCRDNSGNSNNLGNRNSENFNNIEVFFSLFLFPLIVLGLLLVGVPIGVFLHKRN